DVVVVVLVPPAEGGPFAGGQAGIESGALGAGEPRARVGNRGRAFGARRGRASVEVMAAGRVEHEGAQVAQRRGRVFAPTGQSRIRHAVGSPSPFVEVCVEARQPG